MALTRTVTVITCTSCLEEETEEAVRDDGMSLFSRTCGSVWKAESSVPVQAVLVWRLGALYTHVSSKRFPAGRPEPPP